MLGKKKSPIPIVEFDRENQKAILKCSICTGEQVAGFKDVHTGKFTDVCVIRSASDLENFKKLYHVDELEKEY